MVSIYLFIDWKRVFITYFRIRSATANLEFFWSVFSRMRTEYWLNLRNQSESEKKRTRKTTNTDIYHVQVTLFWNFTELNPAFTEVDLMMSTFPFSTSPKIVKLSLGVGLFRPNSLKLSCYNLFLYLFWWMLCHKTSGYIMSNRCQIFKILFKSMY